MAIGALKQRMEYLRYMYTKLFEASKFGGTVIRPLFFEFPLLHFDGEYESSFMVGDALKVSPKLKPGTGKIQSPFPGGISFIDLNDLDIHKEKADKIVDLEPLPTKTVVHLREGKIIPIQPSDLNPALNTYDLIKKSSITLLVYPDYKGVAEGTLYIDDDGESLADLHNENYQYFRFRFTSNNGQSIQFSRLQGKETEGRLSNNEILEEIRILGGVDKQSQYFGCWFDNKMVPHTLNVAPDL